MKFITYLKEKYNSENVLKIEWTIAIFNAVIMLLAFAYVDLKSLTIWSTNILDCIAKGNIKDYFYYTSLNLHSAPHTYLSGVIYMLIPWAIWNIPIWIAQYFYKVEILLTPLALAWSKLFLVALLFLTMIYSKKIVLFLTQNKTDAKWVNFLSFTYAFTYIGIYYAGQNDILTCLLGTMSIYYLLKENKKAFYIIAGFAISVKYFFFIPFVLLVLLTEKNILKIIRNLFIGLLPSIIFYTICFKWPMFLTAGSENGSTLAILKKIIGTSFPMFTNTQISFVILTLSIFAFLAYSVIPKTKEEKNKYIIYFTVAGFGALFLFSGHEFYRMILLMPFIFIMFIQNKDKFRINIILETFFSFFALLTLSVKSSNIFESSKSLKQGVLNQMFHFDLSHPFSTYNFFHEHIVNELDLFIRGTATVGFAALLLILIINYPKSKIQIDGNNTKCERYIIWIRMLLVVPFLMYMGFKLLGF